MFIDMRFYRTGGFLTRTYDRDTHELTEWFSVAWHKALDARLDREIRCRTLARAGLEQ